MFGWIIKQGFKYRTYLLRRFYSKELASPPGFCLFSEKMQKLIFANILVYDFFMIFLSSCFNMKQIMLQRFFSFMFSLIDMRAKPSAESTDFVFPCSPSLCFVLQNSCMFLTWHQAPGENNCWVCSK